MSKQVLVLTYVVDLPLDGYEVERLVREHMHLHLGYTDEVQGALDGQDTRPQVTVVDCG